MRGVYLLALGATLVLVEVVLRRWAPQSAFYRRWTAFFAAVGAVWTGVLLAVVYFLTVAGVSLVLKLLGKDLLDRDVTPEPTFWRAHEASPLGSDAAARHQF